LAGGNAVVDIGVDSSLLGYIQSRNITSTTTYNLLLNPLGGNVGIGTTNPIYKLQIAGSTYVNGGTMFLDSGEYIRWGNSAQSIRGVNDTSLEFVAGSSTRMYVSASGNVGIGTTTPGSKLEIAGALGGTIGVGGSTFRLINTDTFNYASITAGITGVSNSGMQFSTDGTAKMVIDSSGNVGINTTSPSAKLQVKGSGATSATTALHVENTNASASMVVLDDGNVGIGTTNPAATFHVSSSGIVQRLESSNTFTALDFYNTTATANNRNWSIGANLFNYGDFNIMNSVSSGSAPTPANTYLTINKDGNVGIGTINPGYPLDIVGFANSTYGFRVTDGTIDNRISWSSGNVGFFGTVSNHPIAFNTNLSERMRITAGGNVGIGTTTPSYMLDVQQVIRSKYGSNEGGLYLGGTPAGVAYAAGAVRATPSPSYSYTGKLSFYTATWGAGSDYDVTEQMYIETSTPDTKSATLVMLPWGGNVGINTTSPSAKLQVKGSGATSATTALRVENTNASGSLTVLDNGNVGIGANTPISLLQIGSGSGFLGDFTTPDITFNNINNGIYLRFNN
jgi:hypothetical protein